MSLARHRHLCSKVSPHPILRFLRIQLTALEGNLDDLFNRHAWDFHDRSTEQYGPVFTFRGLLGVCHPLGFR